ncbi:MAG: hypothetical protein CBC38_01400 [Gammaproteobacteria bacterium TMED78]|nr:MAG: hypothetical protein CBC38_01400 [Gammaproteobacteria bacterium TMED78]|tara:strand:- start:105 stop:1112 length:1008 start_codon:yes stop_codon:yes gene_type:complete
MNKYILNLSRYLIILLASFFVISCSNDSAEGPYIIKFPHVTAPATPKGQAAQRFKELAEERFPGRVIVEVYPSSQLMNDDDSLEALAFGEIQMIAVSLSKFDRLTNAFQVFDLPFLFPNLQTIEKFQASPAGQSLLDELTDRGFKGLNFWHNGMKIFTATRALNEPGDASGLNFRIMESDVLQAQVQAIGGNPQKMALGEVYQALQTGAIDAQENTWANIYSAKFFEVQEFIMETNHGYVGYLVAVNPSFWNQLPEDLRIGLEQVMDEVSEWGNMRSEIINQEGKENVLEENRNQIIYPSSSQLALWQETMQPVWEEFADQIGTERLEAAKNINN